jgi:hypothetical protein
MKKLTILFIAVSIGMVGCGDKPEGEREEKSGYNILIIDSCEYIEVSHSLGTQYAYYSLTHKGNCSNPIHQK